MPYTVAIDVGKSGGIAWASPAIQPAAEPMPQSEDEVVEFFKTLKAQNDAEHEGQAPTAFIEKVTGFIGNAHPASRMFTFGEGFGFLKGALMASGWRVRLVRPQEWQRGLDLKRERTQTKTEWKRSLKSEAAALFPSLKPTLKTADALLILEYAKRCGGV